MLRIVTDGAADMPVDWETIYQINILPLHVHFGNETFTQGPDFTREDFYRLVKEKRIIPKTSLPSIGQVILYYQSIAQKGDTILSIHVSSKLSGTIACVESAARELAGEFKIIVFDSCAGSVAQAFLAREARCLEQAGVGIQDIIRRLENIREQWTVIFTLDTLEFAYLSGRINAMQSLIGAALQLKPIIVLRDGLLDIAERVRTRRRALAHIIQKVQEQIGGRMANLAVVHAADPTTANQMLEDLKHQLKLKEALITDLAIPVAANLGPRAIGIVAYPLEEEG
ncbi:MAG: DegV family protein [Anaerolineaceae bacterium]|nr:DegV family protein [Anaerolineaceae bacterium]